MLSFYRVLRTLGICSLDHLPRSVSQSLPEYCLDGHASKAQERSQTTQSEELVCLFTQAYVEIPFNLTPGISAQWRADDMISYLHLCSFLSFIFLSKIPTPSISQQKSPPSTLAEKLFSNYNLESFPVLWFMLLTHI